MTLSNNVDSAFITTYGEKVKLAYQDSGGKIAGFTTQRKNVGATTDYFQKIGAGEATDKGVNGDVVPMNLQHSKVPYTLVDKYAPNFIDKLDSLKTNIQLQDSYKKSSVMALGRSADKQILTALDATTSYAGEETDGLTLPKIEAALYDNLFTTGDVPDDGDTVCLVGWRQWSELKNLSQFTSADYVGDRMPWLMGSKAINWMNITWLPLNTLTVSSSVRSCHMFHRASVGHGTGSEVVTKIDPIPLKVSTLVNSYMSMGACIIDSLGVTTLRCLED